MPINQNMDKASILIVDDDRMFAEMLADLATQMGHVVAMAGRLDECRQRIAENVFDLVLLDVGLPDGSGLSILPWLKSLTPAPEVIIITGEGDADGAELAVTSGAWDYLLKTTAIERLNLCLTRALEHRRANLRANSLKILERRDIVGNSPPLKKALRLLAQAAETDFNLLLSGRTGTGKELFARAAHANSDRADAPLVVVDCAALPHTLAESVLFGHVKGAYTGAEKDSSGLIRQAHGGTLFLDEVGELPLGLQKNFLRVLNEKALRPVGSTREHQVDFRLISATNRELDRMVEQGKFRADLLYRLRSLEITLPPLSERRQDIEEIAQHFFIKLAKERNESSKGISTEFRQALEAYPWPGNIRELQNVLESAFSAATGESLILTQHLPPALRVHWMRRSLEDQVSPPTPQLDQAQPPGELPTIREYRRQMDARYLSELMEQAGGDVRLACKKSGLSLSRFYSLLGEHKIKH